MIKKVLIVDDEQKILNLLASVLEEEGFEVETATDGIECGNKLYDNTYDALILDFKMPNLDGLRTIKYLRQGKNMHHKTMKIILHSGFVSDQVREEVENYNVTVHTKPCNVDHLIEDLKE